MKLKNRKGLRKVHLIRLRAPSVQTVDGVKVPTLNGIDFNGDPVAFPCSTAVYKRYNGTDVAGKTVTGLDYRRLCDFNVYLKKKKLKSGKSVEVVMSLDIIPLRAYPGRTIPIKQVGVDTMEFAAYSDSCVELLQYPFNTKLAQVNNIIDGLAEATNIEAGVQLPDGSIVEDTRGNKIFVVPGIAAAPEFAKESNIDELADL